MRTLRLAVAISAAAHAVAVVWLGTRALALPGRTEALTTTPIEIVAVDRPSPPIVAPIAPPVVAIDVALADDHPPASRDPAARPPIASRAPGAHTRDEPAITVPGVGSAGETAPRPPAVPGGLMAMRRGDVPRAVLPAGRWDGLDHVPRGPAPRNNLTTGMLEESGGGTYTSEQGVFVARVSPDGSVKLTDNPNLHVHIALPSPKALGRGLARWYESDKGPNGAEGDTVMAKQIQLSAGATTDPPDPVTGKGKDRATTAVVPVLSGGFDVTDWLMRGHSGDPYGARKLAFLDATRDERARIGARHRGEQLAHATQLMRRNLDALAAAHADLAAQKRTLFELWDECAEAGDPDLVAAGQAARRLVIGFIRAHLPAGGPDAYTPDELAAFARAQQSKVTFQPYE
jgi:hypothetical protein